MDVVRRCVRLAAGATCIVLSAAAAIAADVPVVLKAPAAPAVYNWTGVYLGGHAGYGTGMKDWTSSIFDFDVKGFLGGGQIGVNQQVGNWVLGIEADASWADIKGSQTVRIPSDTSNTANNRIDRIVTVAGRLGFAADRWLVYVKAGGAWAHEAHGFRAFRDLSPFAGRPFVVSTVTSGSENRFGPMLGFGAEYAFFGNWSAKLEYNYVPMGVKSVLITGTGRTGPDVVPVAFDPEINQTLHLVKFGVNYRFDTSPSLPSIAPSRPAPGFDWSGAYVGAQAAAGFGRKAWLGFAPNGEFDVTGWLAGGTLGANAQAGAFVLGVEGDWMWANVDGGGRAVDPIFGGSATQTSDLSSRIDWLATASLRMGFVAADRWLVYAKGGVAFASEHHGVNLVQAFPGRPTAGVVAAFSGNAWHTGYLAGVGIEHAFAGNWSAKVEYDYMAFRAQDIMISGPAVGNGPFFIGTANIVQRDRIRQDVHLLKFGVNYHFSAFPDAVTARY